MKKKTELLLIIGKDCPHMDLLVTVEYIAVNPLMYGVLPVT